MVSKISKLLASPVMKRALRRHSSYSSPLALSYTMPAPTPSSPCATPVAASGALNARVRIGTARQKSPTLFAGAGSNQPMAPV
ncbi:hypothetical protein DUPY_41490 [Duganella phyllosphaerae]|uniref:Uncharacterized protein n=1 Tax=Duganella phyllosphaerae TaxID=762836 RepID=A0A1E7WDH4_9BURK|nr:hypothetical protein DUPY_41490 [Duganella phyllosphaerae]